MDILENLRTIDKIEAVRIDNAMPQEEVIYNEILRLHLIYFLIFGVILILFVVL